MMERLDGQTDSHSIVFCCVESFEEFVPGFGRETGSGIFYAKAHPAAVILFVAAVFIVAVVFSGALVSFRSDEQFSRTIFHHSHGVRSISNQIQDDLLKLHTIAG